MTTPAEPTKKVRIVLAGLMRLEYNEVLEVPLAMTDAELDDLVEERYDTVDGGVYYTDPDYWEQGTCYHERVDSDELSDGIVVLQKGEFVVTECL